MMILAWYVLILYMGVGVMAIVDDKFDRMSLVVLLVMIIPTITFAISVVSRR